MGSDASTPRAAAAAIFRVACVARFRGGGTCMVAYARMCVRAGGGVLSLCPVLRSDAVDMRLPRERPTPAGCSLRHDARTRDASRTVVQNSHARAHARTKILFRFDKQDLKE